MNLFNLFKLFRRKPKPVINPKDYTWSYQVVHGGFCKLKNPFPYAPIDTVTNVKIDKQTFVKCDHEFDFDPTYSGHCPQPMRCIKCGVLDLHGYKGEIL